MPVLLIAALTLLTAQAVAPLKLERTILLRGVEGRIDHLSVDVNNQRLFCSSVGQ
jgi:hypothetical protein